MATPVENLQVFRVNRRTQFNLVMEQRNGIGSSTVVDKIICNWTWFHTLIQTELITHTVVIDQFLSMVTCHHETCSGEVIDPPSVHVCIHNTGIDNRKLNTIPVIRNFLHESIPIKTPELSSVKTHIILGEDRIRTVGGFIPLFDSLEVRGYATNLSGGYALRIRPLNDVFKFIIATIKGRDTHGSSPQYWHIACISASRSGWASRLI